MLITPKNSMQNKIVFPNGSIWFLGDVKEDDVFRGDSFDTFALGGDMNEMSMREDTDALLKVKTLTINNHEDYLMVDAFCVGLSELENKVKKDFEKSKKDAFTAHRSICDQEAGHLGNIAEARKIGKALLSAYEKQVEDKRTTKESETGLIVSKDIPKRQTQIRKTKKFKIVNEALIPREYLIPNEVAIGAVVRALGFAANIPGVEVFDSFC